MATTAEIAVQSKTTVPPVWSYVFIGGKPVRDDVLMILLILCPPTCMEGVANMSIGGGMQPPQSSPD